MENKTEGESAAASHATDTVPHHGFADLAFALDRPLINGEQHRVPLSQSSHLSSHQWRSVFGHHEFTACEIFTRS
jgi:hypothetical protein